MAYTPFTAFRAALDEAGFKPGDEGLFGYYRLFAYYRHALSQSDLTIGKIEDLTSMLAESGSAVDKLSGKLFIEGKGSTKWWSIWANDSYILGGIHGHVDFCLKGNPDALDALDPTAGKYVFKVTQRELIGLTTFGYSSAERTPEGVKFKCTSPALADAATFKKYKDKVGEMVAALS